MSQPQIPIKFRIPEVQHHESKRVHAILLQIPSAREAASQRAWVLATLGGGEVKKMTGKR